MHSKAESGFSDIPSLAKPKKPEKRILLVNPSIPLILSA
jgi:hypothetical protein